MKIHICEINVNAGRREVKPERIQELADSIKAVGLLNPITVERNHTLIAGLHRLEAVKLLEREEIECSVVELEGLQAELAEIDENLIRHNFDPIQEGEQLARRKEIYEMLHPESKAGISQAAGMNRATGKNVSEFDSPTSKSFARDTVDKLGITPRTVQKKVQIATKLTPEVKRTLQDSGFNLSTTNALKFCRLSPEQQREAVDQLTSGAINSVDEYQKRDVSPSAPKPVFPPAPSTPSEPQEPPISQEEKTEELESDSSQEQPVPFKLESKHYAIFAESLADLKDPNKEFICTPDLFLVETTEFIKDIRQHLERHSLIYYKEAIPLVTPEQLAYLRQQIKSIHAAADQLYRSIKEMNAT